MLYLKKVNEQDAQEEYVYITNLPANENGFTNRYYGVSEEDFMQKVLPEMIHFSNGVGLPEGFVPETDFFLWEDNHIVGMFRIRSFSQRFSQRGGRSYRIRNKEGIQREGICFPRAGTGIGRSAQTGKRG